MLSDFVSDFILKHTGSVAIRSRITIQSLWSGYGSIQRIFVEGGKVQSVILKEISFPSEINHPRGWNTSASHERKVHSYEVEQMWYTKYASVCDDHCKVPDLLGSAKHEGKTYLLLEDLDAIGYSKRKSHLTPQEAKVCLKWLAHFHAKFLGVSPNGLWHTGTYWHLATRKEEWNRMEASPLKDAASKLDQLLSNAKYQTFVHGDAKVANFCFTSDMKATAAVDFQYVGGGCGMKDVVYFLGSCLSEAKCERYETELLHYYFTCLKEALNQENKTIEFIDLKKEWSELYAIAWTDFTRFLLGWMPTHRKLNGYSLKLMNKVLAHQI